MHQHLQIELTWQMTCTIESAALNNSLFIFAMLRKDAKSPTAQAQAHSEVTETISALTNRLTISLQNQTDTNNHEFYWYRL